jgi:transcriptional regulator with XRE-family HTH domain
VDLQLKAFLKGFAPSMTAEDLARRVNISEATLRGYLENRWTVLDRTVLERLADFFECDAGTLLTTSESGFFDAFRIPPSKDRYSRPTCLYLRRPDADSLSTGRPAAYRDNRAIDHLVRFLRDSVERMADIGDTVTTPEQFKESLLQNCMVLGSPIVNPAAEMALCCIFDAQPFKPAESAKVPLAFITAEPIPAPRAMVETSPDGKRGIWLREENQLVEADSWPDEEFRRRDIRRGRDCGVVAVLNHRPAAGEYVHKLVVLGGFTGVGTEAAATALVDHYRDLEPREGEAHVWGVIEVFYRKQPNSNHRDILNYNWRCRRGGRCPVEFTRRKS